MISGVGRDFSLRRLVTCDICHGNGGEPGSGEQSCSTCGGQGQVRQAARSLFGSFTQVVTCPSCHGVGKTFTKKCHKCAGEGRTREQQNVHVEIPAGISDGQTISVQGQGESGERGARSGDLYINVHVIVSKGFERKGNNILSVEHISFSQAVLGDKIEVKTVEGSVKMKIPSGTQSGEIFRIKGQGAPELNRNHYRGDQLVTIVVDVPKNPSREQKKLIEALSHAGL
jgi:molecular chaperone DnaJ